jgi:hypothetical protein
LLKNGVFRLHRLPSKSFHCFYSSHLTRGQVSNHCYLPTTEAGSKCCAIPLQLYVFQYLGPLRFWSVLSYFLR